MFLSSLQFQIRQLEAEREKLRTLTITQSAEMERAKREYMIKVRTRKNNTHFLKLHIRSRNTKGKSAICKKTSAMRYVFPLFQHSLLDIPSLLSLKFCLRLTDGRK